MFLCSDHQTTLCQGYTLLEANPPTHTPPSSLNTGPAVAVAGYSPYPSITAEIRKQSRWGSGRTESRDAELFTPLQLRALWEAGLWGGCAEVQHAAASWASLDNLGGKPYREAKSSITTLPCAFASGFSLSCPHHWPELSQPCGQNQSLSLPSVRLVQSPLRPFLKHPQCQGAELCPMQVVGPTGMYSPVLHPTVRVRAAPVGPTPPSAHSPYPPATCHDKEPALLRNQRVVFAATALGTQTPTWG